MITINYVEQSFDNLFSAYIFTFQYTKLSNVIIPLNKTNLSTKSEERHHYISVYYRSIIWMDIVIR